MTNFTNFYLKFIKKSKTQMTTPEKKIRRIYSVTEQLPVDYYDSKEAKKMEERETTETYNHRVFNNWVKSVLIDKYTNLVKDTYEKDWDEKLKLSVLDIACGKGGDLRKWDLAGTRNYFGVDIAYKAIQDAQSRKMQSFRRFCTTFIQQDAGCPTEEFFADIQENMYFDVVSIQFAMHYMFESEEKVRNFLQNVASRLNNGGYFICSHPDSNVIVKKLRERYEVDEQGRFYTGNK